MKREERVKVCMDWFSGNLPDAKSELDFNSPYQLLVAVMLSAQCTDKRVNTITPALFKAFPTVERLAAATTESIKEKIQSVTYPNAKAAHLHSMACMVMERFSGMIPTTLEELVQLPGVGRKTANVVIAVAFGGAAMPVDTHVFRVSHRLGLVSRRCTTPASVERGLVSHIPRELLSKAHHWLLLHGRYTCTSQRPRCSECGLREVCTYHV